MAAGSTTDLIAASSSAPSVSLTTSRPLDRHTLARMPGVTEIHLEGGSARFRATDVNGTLAALVAALQAERVAILELLVHKASLEDVFLELTGATPAD